jgi:hypothetical protein
MTVQGYMNLFHNVGESGARVAAAPGFELAPEAVTAASSI